MLRRLVFFAIIFFAGYLLYRYFVISRKAAQRSGPSHVPPPQDAIGNEKRPEPPKDRGEDMVYDEMCKSYIAEANALKMERDGKTYYFCGGACRQMFMNSFGINPY